MKIYFVVGTAGEVICTTTDEDEAYAAYNHHDEADHMLAVDAEVIL